MDTVSVREAYIRFFRDWKRRDTCDPPNGAMANLCAGISSHAARTESVGGIEEQSARTFS